jgi:hypothetical protein
VLALIPPGLYCRTLASEFLDFDNIRYVTGNRAIYEGITASGFLDARRRLARGEFRVLEQLAPGDH